MDDLLAKSKTLQNIPDNILAGLMQGGPGSQVPPFLVLGEIQRRKDLRASVNAGPQAPAQTVAQEAMSGMQQPVQHYASGGQVRQPPFGTAAWDEWYRAVTGGGMLGGDRALPRMDPTMTTIAAGQGATHAPAGVAALPQDKVPNLYDPGYRDWFEAQAADVPSPLSGIGNAPSPSWSMPPRMEYPALDATVPPVRDPMPAKHVQIIPREGPSADWAPGDRLPSSGKQDKSLMDMFLNGLDMSAVSMKQPLESLEAQAPPAPGMPAFAQAPEPPMMKPSRGIAALGDAAGPKRSVGGPVQAAPEAIAPKPLGLGDYLAQAQGMRKADGPAAADPYADVKARLAAMDAKSKDGDKNALADFAIQAGLGMMSSRNPSFLGAAGEGGLQGFQGYLEGKKSREHGDLERMQISADIEARQQAAQAALAQGDRQTAMALMQEARLMQGQQDEKAYRQSSLSLDQQKLGIMASRAARGGQDRSTEGERFARQLMSENPGLSYEDALKRYYVLRGKPDPLASLLQGQQQDQPTEDDLMGAL